MAADPQAPDAQSDDLFGRWLAHHEQQSNDGDTSGQDVTDHDPPPRLSRRMPAAAIASSAVESDPMIGRRLQPPSNFGVRSTPANAPSRSGSPGELPDIEMPSGWEPIVMASARRKADPRPPRRPKEQTSRLQRLKARFVDPKDPTPEPDVAPAPAQAAAGPAPTTTPLPTRTPAPAVTRSIEETIRAAVPEHQVARHVDPPIEHRAVTKRVEQPVAAPVATVVETVEPVAHTAEPEAVAAPTPVRAFIDTTPLIEQPAPEPALEQPRPKHAVVAEPEPELPPLVNLEPVVAESVVAEAEPVAELVAEPEVEPVVEPAVEPEPAPVAVPVAATVTEAEPPAQPAGRRSFLSRGSREPKSPQPPKARRVASAPPTGDAARDLVAAKARARAAEPAPQPAPQVEAGTVAVEAPPEPEVAPAPRRVSKHDQVATEMPGVYKFAPKKTSRRLLTIALLCGLVFSAYFVNAAVDTKDTASMGLAAIVLLATAMVWAIRAGAAPTTLEVHQGQLEVVRQGGRYVFDLASNYTQIEVRGRPGRHGWRVLFPRRGMAPFAVDATMVDPDDFMRVLRFFRPDLVTR
jgi:hypothetical protein